jgi:predicted dehydrogenase
MLARNGKRPEMAATRTVFEKTLAAFADGTPPPASAEDGRDVLEVIAACYQSAASGRRVVLDSPEVRALTSLRMGAA